MSTSHGRVASRSATKPSTLNVRVSENKVPCTVVQISVLHLYSCRIPGYLHKDPGALVGLH